MLGKSPGFTAAAPTLALGIGANTAVFSVVDSALRGEPYTVIGVMPPDFKTSALAEVGTPLRRSTVGEGGDRN